MSKARDPKEKLAEDINWLNPEDWKKVNRFVAKLKTLERMEAKEFNKMVSNGLADHRTRYDAEIGMGELSCSFCGKNQDMLKKLVAGPGVFICNECIEVCNEILAEDEWDDEPEIDRLYAAQKGCYESARRSIEDGRSLDSEWVKCLLPRPLGVTGSSKAARFYGIGGIAEAKSYLKDAEMKKMLMGICNALLDRQEEDIKKILLPLDEKALHMTMTMFHIVQPRNKTFKTVLDKFFGGKLDRKTEVMCREVWK